MMQNFQKLDVVLETEYASDAWSDDVVLVANRILESFTHADWETLQDAWQDKKASWQYRLADCLSDAPPEKAVGILLAMVSSMDENVSRASAISLNGFKDHLEASMLTDAQKERILTIADKSPFTQMALRELVKKIKSLET